MRRKSVAGKLEDVGGRRELVSSRELGDSSWVVDWIAARWKGVNRRSDLAGPEAMGSQARCDCCD